ncbi:MAG: diacylglycerol kinase family protein [Coriobacteriaceae bacterium]|nr:diacylglycerol kinase family protein [Coriobacteriaceae bacterium]
MIPGQPPRHPGFIESFSYALKGVKTAFIQERNIKVMLAGGTVTIIAGLLVHLDAISWAIVLLCCGAVLASELFNTAIETVVDLVSPEFNELAGRAKDIAAAAELLLCTAVAIVGLIVFIRALLS